MVVGVCGIEEGCCCWWWVASGLVVNVVVLRMDVLMSSSGGGRTIFRRYVGEVRDKRGGTASSGRSRCLACWRVKAVENCRQLRYRRSLGFRG